MAVTREKILEIARTLPPAPRIFSTLDRMLLDPDNALGPIADLIKQDAALAAHLIRVSNSVVYGGEQRMGSVEEAVGRLGFQLTFRLVGEAASLQLVERPLRHYGIDADQLREHMLHTAFMCEHVALEVGRDPRRAYTAGLMRPLGLLVLDRLADHYPSLVDYHPARDADYLVWEGRTFGVAGAEVAAMVLGEWGFPTETVDAVRNQYLLRSESLGEQLTCVLNLASGLVADDGHALLGEARHWGRSPWKLEAVGLTEERFQAAAARGRSAFAEFQRRLRGEPGLVPAEAQPMVPAPAAPRSASSVPTTAEPHGSMTVESSSFPLRVRVMQAAEEAPVPAPSAVTPAPEAAQPHGSMAVESSNFPLRVRVVQSNDDIPVHTPPSGLIPPADFPTFMRAYQDMVFSTAARLTGNETQAEDIAQEVFLKAHERFDSLRTSPTAGGWLKTVATNLSLNHLSRYRNRWKFFSEFRREGEAGEDQPAVEFAAPDTFFAGVDAEERRAAVEHALAQLPAHQRVPLVLYHFEDLPYEEIARKLGVSLAKVKTDILRARATLAKILQRSGAARETLDS